MTLNVPKLTKGATSGADFTLSGTNTGVSTINTVWEGIPAAGAEEGSFYAARITLTAENGYAFNTSTQVKLNGDYLSKGSGIENGGAGMIVYVNVPFDMNTLTANGKFPAPVTSISGSAAAAHRKKSRITGNMLQVISTSVPSADIRLTVKRIASPIYILIRAARLPVKAPTTTHRQNG